MSDKSSLGESGVPSQQSCPQFDACGAGCAQSGFPPNRFSSVIRSGYGGFAGEETFDGTFSCFVAIVAAMLMIGGLARPARCAGFWSKHHVLPGSIAWGLTMVAGSETESVLLCLSVCAASSIFLGRHDSK